MSITPTAITLSASPRPDAGVQASFSVSTGSLPDSPFGGYWVCSDHMSTSHNPTTGGHNVGSKRLDPGSFTGVLT